MNIMALSGGRMKKLSSVVHLPEMRVFWILLPAFALLFLVHMKYLPGPLVIASAAFLVLVAGVVYAAVARAGGSVQEVVRERNQFKSIVASMEDGLIVYDRDFTVLFMNDSAERLFGAKKEVLIGKRIGPQDVEKPELRRLIQSLFPTLAPSMVPRSRSGEYPQVVDVVFDAPYLELRTITSPVPDDRGEVLGFMKIIRNRTREASLAKAKNEFITVASHQLRTPITNIHWTLESLASNASLDEATKSVVENAFVSAKQLRTIVEDLLSIARIEEGRFGYNFEKADVVAFLEKLLSEVMPQARRIGISMYFDHPDAPLPEVMIDAQKLSMAISNLLDNAIRYNVKSGKVTVAARPLAGKPYVEITVSDTGIGIPPEEVEKLFSKFYRASNAVKSAADGSGLGLYITQNVVQAHGGTIWVESELNRGTTFHITLPTDFSLIPPKEVPLEF